MKTNAIFALLTIGTGLFAASLPTEYQAYKRQVLKTPGLIRFYTFEEGQGEEVYNHVPLDAKRTAVTGGSLGSLTVPYYNPYRYDSSNAWNPTEDDNPLIPFRWGRGRFPGKGSIIGGNNLRGLYRSGISGKEFGAGFTFGLWLRFHDAKSTGHLLALKNVKGSNGTFQLNKKKDGLAFQILGEKWKRLIDLSAAALPVGKYFNVVVTYDYQTVRMYIDGALAASAPSSAKIAVSEMKIDSPLVKPFYEFSPSLYSGFEVLSDVRTFHGTELDELAIFERALTAAEIAELASAGRPTASEAAQISDFAAMVKEMKIRDQIKIEISPESAGYFRIGQPVPISVLIPESTGLSGGCQAHFDIQTLTGKKIAAFSRRLTIGEPLTENLSFPQCDTYNIAVTVVDRKGITLKAWPRPCSVGIVPPAPKHMSVTNPLGYWATYDKFSYDTTFRREAYWNAKSFAPKHEKLKKVVPNLNLSLFFFWRLAQTQQAREWNQKIIKEALPTLKAIKPLPVLEVTSEPHNYTPQAYVEVLKMIHDNWRKELPDLLIIPPGGTPVAIPDIDKMMKAGGWKYVNGLSYHPYSGRPIDNFYTRKSNRQLKAIAARYPERDLLLWNTESGNKILPRVKNNRPMTEQEAITAKFRPITTPNGYRGFADFIFRFEEDKAATVQVQGILADLAFGFKKYVVCQSPGADGYPSRLGVALTALGGQILNPSKAITALPSTSMDNLYVLLENQDGTLNAAFFSDRHSVQNFQVAPSTTYKTMDLYGNFGTIKSGKNGFLSLSLSPKVQYVFDVPKTIREIVPITLTLPKVLPDSGNMSGTVTVTNHGAHRFEGSLSFDPIVGAVITPARTQLALAPGDSQKVEIKLKSERLKRRDYRCTANLNDKSGAVTANAQVVFQSNGSLRKIYQFKKEIKLDGDESKWAGIPEYVCDNETDVVAGKPNLAEIWLPQWTSKDDLSFRVKTAWRRNDGIYFLLMVRDDHLVPAPADKTGVAFQYDSLELFFDSRKRKEQASFVTPGADQAVVVAQAGAELKPCDYWFAKKGQEHISVTCVGRKTDDGYLIEGKIVPNAKSRLSIRPGSQFCMDFSINDTDDPKVVRKATMALDGVANNYVNSSAWGRYELVLDVKD
jgi:hypothetical protein